MRFRALGLVVSLVSALVVAPLAPEAQQAGKVPGIGWLMADQSATTTRRQLLAVAVVAAAGPLEPLVVDWASYFTVDWQATQLDGRAVVRGTVSNPTGWGAKRIQLLVEGLDATAQIVVQRVVWLGVDLPPSSHAGFEVPMTPASASYRVRIFAFDTSRRK